MTSTDAKVRITLRLSDDDYGWILKEIKETGATVTGFIRTLIHKERKAKCEAQGDKA